MKMHRYLLFSWEVYSPGGGMLDCVGAFIDVASAVDHFKEHCCDFGEIWDWYEGKLLQFTFAPSGTRKDEITWETDIDKRMQGGDKVEIKKFK